MVKLTNVLRSQAPAHEAVETTWRPRVYIEDGLVEYLLTGGKRRSKYQLIVDGVGRDGACFSCCLWHSVYYYHRSKARVVCVRAMRGKTSVYSVKC